MRNLRIETLRECFEDAPVDLAGYGSLRKWRERWQAALKEVEWMPTTIIKLASLVVHLVEAQSKDGHAFDIQAAKSLMADPEVAEMLTPGPLIPHTRSGKSVAELLNQGAA